MSIIVVNGKPLEALVEEARALRVELGDEVLDGVADLVLRLHQREATEARAILPPAMMRTYSERSAAERAGMRSACKHVVMALVLTGVIDLPGAGG
jgi:hypothetical protein